LGWNFLAFWRLVHGMKSRIRFLGALAALGGLVAGGCADKPAPLYTPPPPVEGATYAPAPAQPPGTIQEPPPGVAVAAPVPPPALPAEVAPPAPGPDYVWTAGYYNWNGTAWVWAPGVWVLPPRRGAVWFGGHWEYRAGRHVWMGGRWR
jgi:hypothetical protein